MRDKGDKGIKIEGSSLFPCLLFANDTLFSESNDFLSWLLMWIKA